MHRDKLIKLQKIKSNIRLFMPVCSRAVLIAAIIMPLALTGCSSLPKRRQIYFDLQPGDLLFQDLNGDSFFEAIAKVTEGYNGSVLTHVGIAARNDTGDIVILEALLEGVSETPLDVFLDRSRDEEGNPKVLVGRLREEQKHLIEPALAGAFSRKNKPYNHLFDINDGNSYYCSELVYVCFMEANGGEPVFQLEPMTFSDPDTQEVFPVWEEYFDGLGAEVPEGAPGLNPGGMSRSPVLQIVHVYGKPGGWKENQ